MNVSDKKLSGVDKARVLVVEDDEDIGNLVRMRLAALGCEVDIMREGNQAADLAASDRGPHYDVVILDLMLPGANGYEVCKAFRSHGHQCGILMLTAKHLMEDKILGFDVGADDYLTKPFLVEELEARVIALLRRVQMSDVSKEIEVPRQITCSELVIDTVGKKAFLRKEEIQLSPIEYRLLEYFALHPGQAFSRTELLMNVWGYNSSTYENTVNTTINRLRIKVENDPAQPYYIQTVRGYGYRFYSADEIPSEEK